MVDKRITAIIGNSTLATGKGRGDPLERGSASVTFHLTSPDENWVHHPSYMRFSTQKQGRNGVWVGRDFKNHSVPLLLPRYGKRTKVKVNPQQLDFRSQVKEDISNFSTCSAAHLKPF